MDGARTEAEAEENTSCVSFSGSSIHLSDPHPFLSNKRPNVVGRKGKKNLRVANGFPHRGPPQHRGSNSQMSGPEKQKEERKKKKKRRQQGCVDARRNVSSGGNVSDSACLTKTNQDSVGWWTELGCAPKNELFPRHSSTDASACIRCRSSTRRTGSGTQRERPPCRNRFGRCTSYGAIRWWIGSQLLLALLPTACISP